MIKLVCVGKCKEKALVQLIQEYTKRISGYSKIEIIETEELMAPQNNSAAQKKTQNQSPPFSLPGIFPDKNKYDRAAVRSKTPCNKFTATSALVS